MKRKDYIEGATLHGLNRAYSASRRSERFFWISMIIGGLFGLTIGFSILVTKYLKYKVNLEVTDCINNQVEFPSISLCNNQRISTDYMTGEDHENNLHSAFSEHFYEYATNFSLFCYAFGNRCNLTEDFSTYGYKDPCVTWNMKGLAKQKLPGVNNGIRMIFFHNASSLNKQSYTTTKNTITIVLHSSNEYPSLYFDNIEIGAGVQTRIELKKKQYSRLPSPYPSNCTDITSLSHTQHSYTYTRNSCLEKCFVDYILRKCGDVIQPRCRVLVSDWMIAKYKKNVTAQEMSECLQDLKFDFYLEGLKMCHCPLACSEVVYSRRIQTVPLDEEALYQSISQNFNLGTLDHFKKSVFYINVYYPRLEFENVVENQAYQLSDVFNDFGGLLGLAVGASLISVVEILAICCLSLFAKKQQRINHK